LREPLTRSNFTGFVADCDSARLVGWKLHVPLPDTGIGFHGPRMVELPSCRIFSEAGRSERGDGRDCTNR
jgi:hypothetical protein